MAIKSGIKQQDRPAQRLPLQVGVDDQEVGGDDDRRGRLQRLFVDDAGDGQAARHPGALGEQHPAQHVEDAAGHVAGQQRLAPGDLRPARPELVAEEAQDQVPADRVERVEDRQDDEGRDQPEDVEVHPLVLDLGPLVDDGEDEEAEDEDRDAELDREPHALAARRLGSEFRPGLADAM